MVNKHRQVEKSAYHIEGKSQPQHALILKLKESR